MIPQGNVGVGDVDVGGRGSHRRRSGGSIVGAAVDGGGSDGAMVRGVITATPDGAMARGVITAAVEPRLVAGCLVNVEKRTVPSRLVI